MEHGKHQQPMDLPPGFRFHPTDEELITHYLAKKAADARFAARAIGEADLNKCEPWDLPSRAKMGEKEWYFFCLKDRKYPTGLRTNRATESGYWKATGKDREIRRGKALVGMKKTLVFYTGRAPKGGKTNWVMHEYRLEQSTLHAYNLPKASKNECVLCRVFEKSSAGSVAAKKGAMADGLVSSHLPPLMDMSGIATAGAAAAEPLAHVTCFSNAVEAGQFLHAQTGTGHLDLASSAAPLLASMPYAQHGVSLVQLLEGNGYGLMAGRQQACKGERERLSASQDTGITSDMNREISSSVQDMGREILWRAY